MHLLAISSGAPADRGHWRAVLASGIDALMIREKHLDGRPLLELTRWVQAEAPGVAVWVNGRLDVALAAGCGCHAPEAYPDVPLDLVPLSRPVHDPAQFAHRLACRQLLVSPIFEVPGKGPAWGAARLHAALDALPSTDARVLALGGIQVANLPDLRHPRLAGVAMIRALWESRDPARLVQDLRGAWSE